MHISLTLSKVSHLTIIVTTVATVGIAIGCVLLQIDLDKALSIVSSATSPQV